MSRPVLLSRYPRDTCQKRQKDNACHTCKQASWSPQRKFCHHLLQLPGKIPIWLTFSINLRYIYLLIVEIRYDNAYDATSYALRNIMAIVQFCLQ